MSNNPESATQTQHRNIGSLSRRGFLAATGVAATGAIAGGVLLPEKARAQTPPPQASDVGYTRLALGDDFDSIDTIDVDATNQSGYNWYATQWFGQPPTPTDNVQVSDSVLTLGGGTDSGGQMAALRTAIARPDAPHFTGSVFGNGGYFEARLAFDPALGTQADRHFPAFWSMAVEHVYDAQNPDDEQWPGQAPGYAHFSEVDFFEAFNSPNQPYDKTHYLGTLHDWSGLWEVDNWQYNIQTGNRVIETGGVDWNQFHTFGTLWVPQRGDEPGYARFYFENLPGPTVYWTEPIGDPPLPGQPPGREEVGEYTPDAPDKAAATFAITDQQRQVVVLTTDYHWPIRVDWVRIWQAPLLR